MKKFIAYEKLSKKEKRLIDRRQRVDWGGIVPITRRNANAKAYNRKKSHGSDYPLDEASFFALPAGFFYMSSIWIIGLSLVARSQL